MKLSEGRASLWLDQAQRFFRAGISVEVPKKSIPRSPRFDVLDRGPARNRRWATAQVIHSGGSQHLKCAQVTGDPADGRFEN